MPSGAAGRGLKCDWIGIGVVLIKNLNLIFLFMSVWIAMFSASWLSGAFIKWWFEDVLIYGF